MKACSGYPERISAFIDGCLPERERLELMEHMAACPACQAYFNDQIAIHEALAGLEAEAPEGFGERVMEQVRLTAQERPARRRALRSRRQGWVAAAACCAVALLGVWAVEGGAGGREEAAVDVVSFSASVTTGAAPRTQAAPTEEAAAEEGAPVSSAQAPADDPVLRAQNDAAQTAECKIAGEKAASDHGEEAAAAEPAGCTLPGAAEINPSVMVEGRIYTWAAMAGGAPEGYAPAAQLEHVPGDVPREDGQFAAVFDAEGRIYADPARPESVYVQITTDWLEEDWVRFDLRKEAGS